MASIYVGTSSWSQHKGFYPKDLASTHQITYYAQHFALVEINATFYRIMPRHNYQVWAERTPPGFVFDVKPYRRLTWHDRDNPPDDDVIAEFRDSLVPMREAEKLGAVHCQFPPWFKRAERNIAYIVRLNDLFDVPISVEFRHRSWLEGDHLPELLATLRDHEIGLTVVDEPDLGSGTVPTVVQTTASLSIVRLHGRNYEKWYARVKNPAERHDYLYSPEELEAWRDRIATLAGEADNVHVLFNNAVKDYAVRNARQLRELLQEALSDHEIVDPTKP